MTSANHNVEGLPSVQKDIPNKVKPVIPSPPFNVRQKWQKSALDTLASTVMDFLPVTEDFDKLNNPFVLGLKNFSPTYEMYCPKCDACVKMTKHGKTNDSYQFLCANGEKPHQVSALQIIDSLPDEWTLQFIDLFESAYLSLLLSWAGKEHLCPELWETKGLKNATKRFATEMSPIKPVDTKIRAVNNSLENEVKELKKTVELMAARLTNFEVDNKNLRSALKAASEENDMLRKYFAGTKDDAENKDDTDVNDEMRQLRKTLKTAIEENNLLKKHLGEGKAGKVTSKDSFAAVANIHKPAKPAKKFPELSPLEVISKGPITKIAADENLEETKTKYEYSPLKMIYFEGCCRRAPVVYRNMFKTIGIENKSVKDISFLTEDILQIMTYESAISAITTAIEKLSPTARRLVNFDPCKASSYSECGDYTDEQAKAAYFAMMTKSAERLGKLAETVKSLKRTAAFTKKIVELKTTNYEPAIRKPRIFFMGDFIIAPEKQKQGDRMEVVADEKATDETTTDNKIEDQNMDTAEVTPADINDGGCQ